MRFAPTPEAVDLREVVADLLSDRCPPAAVRDGAAGDGAAAVLDGLAELGATGVLVPEPAGGLGLDETYLVPLLMQIGHAAVPLPLLETLAVAPPLLVGTEMLDDLLAGRLRVVADPAGRGIVPFADGADLLLRGGFGGQAPIELVDISSADRTRVAAVDAAAGLSQIQRGDLIAVIDDPLAVRSAWRRGALGAAAMLLGLSRRMLDMTVAYVREREQFGVPIGSFQAVKHHLATAALEWEFAQPPVAAAAALAASSDTDSVEVDRAVATAKALASDAAATVARTTLQCHGAIAYTTEYDWHLYAKRAWALAAQWGSAAWHRRVVADTLGLPATGTRPAS